MPPLVDLQRGSSDSLGGRFILLRISQVHVRLKLLDEAVRRSVVVIWLGRPIVMEWHRAFCNCMYIQYRKLRIGPAIGSHNFGTSPWKAA